MRPKAGAVVADTLASVILLEVSRRGDFSFAVGMHFRVSGCGLWQKLGREEICFVGFLARLRKTDE